MIYSSRDIETTGTDPNRNQILSIGIVIEDTEKKLSFDKIPKFYGIIAHKEIYGNLVALEMNKDLIAKINQYNKDGIGNNFYKYEQDTPLIETYIAQAIKKFLRENNLEGKINVAGKNFGTFDKLFLEKLPGFDIQFSNRIIDPAILFVYWNKDETLPNLSECKKRAGLDDNVSHNALEDARDVVQVLRTKYLEFNI